MEAGLEKAETEAGRPPSSHCRDPGLRGGGSDPGREGCALRVRVTVGGTGKRQDLAIDWMCGGSENEGARRFPQWFFLFLKVRDIGMF